MTTAKSVGMASVSKIVIESAMNRSRDLADLSDSVAYSLLVVLINTKTVIVIPVIRFNR